MFEDIRHERSIILLISLTNPDILKQRKLTDHEIGIIKTYALEKLHRQRKLKEYAAVLLTEQSFLPKKQWLIQTFIQIESCSK